ncbi:MAG TPA: N-acetyltransferase [Aurantimonas coralicida]|uniref:N-acetyltransferase n=2 Tax=root TaxID=1 RepID=A0A9C9NIU9_9HYPH|nr:N-acetyltransferase [Aurantimonas coralicida]HEU02735.1 N-acetyltransferase [Aurantimonas coralicida]
MMIRLATMEDARLLFSWRNDPLTRRMSINSDTVDWDTHRSWLERRLGRADPLLHIAEIEGHCVGTFRIDGDEISYTVAPDFRGKGIALKMLILARQMFGPKLARIARDNVPSARAAEKAGHTVAWL